MIRLHLKCDGTCTETRFRLLVKRTSPFKSTGASVQSTTGSWGVRISSSDAGYTMFRGSVKSTGYPLHLPVSLSLPLPRVTVCHHISTGLYLSLTYPQLECLESYYHLFRWWQDRISNLINIFIPNICHRQKMLSNKMTSMRRLVLKNQWIYMNSAVKWCWHQKFMFQLMWIIVTFSCKHINSVIFYMQSCRKFVP